MKRAKKSAKAEPTSAATAAKRIDTFIADVGDCRGDRLLKELSATTAIAGGVGVRRKTDGQELERAGVVCLMQRTGGEWQIATIVIHDADDALRPA